MIINCTKYTHKYVWVSLHILEPSDIHCICIKNYITWMETGSLYITSLCYMLHSDHAIISIFRQNNLQVFRIRKLDIQIVLKTLWKMKHLLPRSKCSIFHSVIKSFLSVSASCNGLKQPLFITSPTKTCWMEEQTVSC